MKEIVDMVTLIERDIFEFKINNTGDMINNFIEELISCVYLLSEEETIKLRGILNYVNIALSNYDYLLFADLLEYEISPLLKNTLSN